MKILNTLRDEQVQIRIMQKLELIKSATVIASAPVVVFMLYLILEVLTNG